MRLPLAALLTASALVQSAAAAELLLNRTFDTSKESWWTTPNLDAAAVKDGALCVEVPGGTSNPWDAIVGQNALSLTEGETYSFSFRATGTPRGPVRALVQMPVDPYTAWATLTPTVEPVGETQTVSFVAPTTIADAQIVFQVGGSSEPWTLCLDEASLVGGAPAVAYVPDTGPRVRVNQLGYLPDGPKRATLVSDKTTPLDFALLNQDGVTVFEGKTEPRGVDSSAGVNVHVIDFTDYDGDGRGLVLKADGEESHPFRIDADLYETLGADALHYFYLARSGIAIEQPWADKAYVRPAGHLGYGGGEAINQGDYRVPCQGKDGSTRPFYGENWTCDYTLDVTGGWYDAGDHGKYVVNAGISVAQLLMIFERALVRDGAALEGKSGTGIALVGDEALKLPEAGNGVPDLLDEVRWELEWMLKMVVPEGKPMAGMVHHKVHDAEWTGIPLLPHRDDKKRQLHRPSTAATLNLAAVAAQASRLYRPYDAKFADRLLAAAVSAYEEAVSNAPVYAPAADGNNGGGPYDDADVSDEFYWAAAELFIATDEPEYLTDLKASPYWDEEAFLANGFDWQNVEGLARLQLSLHGDALSERDRRMVRNSVFEAADGYLEVQESQPFGQPYAPEDGKYAWGSTHLVIQNALVMATAFDMSKGEEQRWRQGALEAMDYVFGRNALNISYVTGYGTHFSQNQHSRWFAKQVNPELPNPPRGALAGGPNSSIQDPVAQRLFAATGCAAQTCYVDDIESWSTNEITINWNAALSQMAAWLNDQ